jgi:hypothetical protein
LDFAEIFTGMYGYGTLEPRQDSDKSCSLFALTKHVFFSTSKHFQFDLRKEGETGIYESVELFQRIIKCLTL